MDVFRIRHSMLSLISVNRLKNVENKKKTFPYYNSHKTKETKDTGEYYCPSYTLAESIPLHHWSYLTSLRI